MRVGCYCKLLLPIGIQCIQFVSISLSLSLCVYRVYLLHTQVLHNRVLILLPHWRPSSPTSGIRAWRFFDPLPAAIKTFNILFLLSIEETEKKGERKKSASHCVRSQIRVSRPAVLCLCDCNRLKGTPCATTDTIVLQSVRRHSNRSPNVVHPSL